jgi:Fungal Zn(2)-Cys(6) binuclear cluster domain
MSSMAASPAQTQNKRKASAANLATGGRNIKRRASKACHCCRSRKVRCDVVESGIPCTNCRLDEVECLVTEGKRRRKSYIDGELLNHSPPLSAEDDKDLPPFPVFDSIDALNNISLIVDGKGASMTSPGDPLSQHTPHMLCRCSQPGSRAIRLTSYI